ncbi:MAG: hypothetical protein K2M93_09815 [Muribaculaceae bacterium]|nr:hypothetical protein [Muribaculaceae bacterium]
MSENLAYRLIRVAYRSRFVFRTDAEYRKALGVSFETVVNNCGSVTDMERYYDNLCRATDYNTDLSLRSLIADYVEASEFYLSLDWGDRAQMASRRRFCRMLFRLYASGGMALTADEIFKFKIKDADERLLNAFFPEGTDKAPAVNIGYIMLFAFGLLKPWSDVNTRSRDFRDEETRDLLDRLRRLIVCLRDDIPRLGSLDKPFVFDDWLNAVDEVQKDDELEWATPMRFVLSMIDCLRASRSLTDAALTRETVDNMHGLTMNGIWIDDADDGKTRFWVFPDNLLAAFCYQRNGNAWELLPYEMRIRPAVNPEYLDTMFLTAPELNERLIVSPEKVVTDGDRYIAEVSFELEWDDDDEEIVRFDIVRGMGRFPEWLNWDSWVRMNADDDRYKEFREVIKAIYDPANPDSMVFRNALPEITDFVNNIVGRDRKYIYLYDFKPGRFAIFERTSGVFTYEEVAGKKREELSLFDLDISEEQPLYALPINVKERKFGRLDLDRFAEMLRDGENVKTGYIIHSERTKHPRLLFSDYGVIVSLDMEELKKLGVKAISNTR